MKVLVIGKKRGNFTDDKGVAKESYKVFCTHKKPFDTDYAEYEGEACSELSLPKEVWDLVEIGKRYSFDFDKNGKLYEVEEL